MDREGDLDPVEAEMATVERLARVFEEKDPQEGASPEYYRALAQLVVVLVREAGLVMVDRERLVRVLGEGWRYPTTLDIPLP